MMTYSPDTHRLRPELFPPAQPDGPGYVKTAVPAAAVTAQAPVAERTTEATHTYIPPEVAIARKVGAEAMIGVDIKIAAEAHNDRPTTTEPCEATTHEADTTPSDHATPEPSDQHQLPMAESPKPERLVDGVPDATTEEASQADDAAPESLEGEAAGGSEPDDSPEPGSSEPEAAGGSGDTPNDPPDDSDPPVIGGEDEPEEEPENEPTRTAGGLPIRKPPVHDDKYIPDLEARLAAAKEAYEAARSAYNAKPPHEQTEADRDRLAELRQAEDYARGVLMLGQAKPDAGALTRLAEEQIEHLRDGLERQQHADSALEVLDVLDVTSDAYLAAHGAERYIVGLDGKVYAPTPRELIVPALQSAKIGPGDVFVDIGSGDGRWDVAAAIIGAEAHGYESDEGRHALAVSNVEELTSRGLLDEEARGRIHLHYERFVDADIRNATAFSYYQGGGPALPGIVNRISRECATDATLIVYRAHLSPYEAAQLDLEPLHDEGLAVDTGPIWDVRTRIQIFKVRRHPANPSLAENA